MFQSSHEHPPRRFLWSLQVAGTRLLGSEDVAVLALVGNQPVGEQAIL